MTLSSPERPADTVQAWQPADLAAARQQAAPTARGAEAADAATVVGAPVPAELFEVSPTAGIPEAVLSPARLAAQSAGYVAGWNCGREAGQLAVEAEAELIREAAEQQARAHRAEIARAVTALHDAARALEQRSVPPIDEVEQLILHTAFQVAEALVGVHLADDRVRGRAALQRALAAAAHDVPMVVRLNPADLAVLEAAGLELDDSVTVVADRSLAPGDAVATTATTRIDARIAAGLERVRRELVREERP